MRTDAQIDRQQVKLPKADATGFGKRTAQFGDMVVYRERWNDGTSDCARLARVAGRVHYAPALEGDKGAVVDQLLVIAFSDDMTFVMERWIKADDVVRCYTPTDKQRAMLAYMFGDAFKQESANELREWSASGYATFNDFLASQLRPKE